MSQGHSAGAGFRMKTGARAESYGKADRSSCSPAFHWSESRKRVVEKIVDMQEPQAMEKTTRVSKITQQVEYTQYQLQLVSGQNPAANR